MLLLMWWKKRFVDEVRRLFDHSDGVLHLLAWVGLRTWRLDVDALDRGVSLERVATLVVDLDHLPLPLAYLDLSGHESRSCRHGL